MESADVTLMCEGERFPAHKVILAARSDVFSAMFQYKNTKEAETNLVEIEDANSTTVKNFLR